MKKLIVGIFMTVLLLTVASATEIERTENGYLFETVLKNESDAEKTYVLYMAEYTYNGQKLKRVITSEGKMILPGESCAVSALMPVESSGALIKAFVWEQGNLAPVSSVAVLDTFYDTLNYENVDGSIKLFGVTGKNLPLCLYVKDSSGKLAYINQTQSNEDGYYEFVYLPDKGDTYIGTVSGLGLDKVLSVSFKHTTESVALKDSYVLYHNSPVYYSGDYVINYDEENPSYSPPFKNGVMYMPASVADDFGAHIRTGNGKITVSCEAGMFDVKDYFISGDNVFVSFNEIMASLGYDVTTDGGLIVAEKSNKKMSKTEIIQKMKNIGGSIISDGFETDSGEWEYQYWGNGFVSVCGQSSANKADGESSQFVSAVRSSFGGLVTQNTYPLDKQKSYQFSADIMPSSKYSGNKTALRLLLYKDGKFVSSVSKSNIQIASGEWQNCNVIINDTWYADVDADSFKVLISNAYTSGVAAGGIYVDNLVFKEITPQSGSVVAEIEGKNYANWYVLEEEVTFKSNDKSLNVFENITGFVKNSDGETVDEVTVTAVQMQSTGWSWKASVPGFYTVEFAGARADGSKTPIVSYYIENDASKNMSQLFESSARSFAVVNSETKDISERNEKMYFSDSVVNDTGLKLADLVGFSGVRIHCIPWGPYWGDESRSVNPSQGVYNWGIVDDMMSKIGVYDYNAIGNVIFTPKWASSRSDLATQDKYGLYGYSTYAPSNPEYFGEFMSQLTARYKDKIKIWEIFNEPHIPGQSIFWNDSAENYGKVLTAGYNAIKDEDGSSIVTIGGIGARRYTEFYDRFCDTDAYDSFDYLAMHGYQVDPWTYNDIAKNHGLEEKPYMTTEAHMILRDYADEVLSEKEISMRMLKEYFREAKNGSALTSFFAMTGVVEMEALPFIRQTNGTSHSSGLFRKDPLTEPRHCGVVLHNYFEKMGRNFAYVAEFELSDGQKAVWFETDSRQMLVLWNEQNETFELDPQIKAAFTATTTIEDWEGAQSKSLNEMLKGSTVYFIENLNKTALDKIEKSADGVINYDN